MTSRVEAIPWERQSGKGRRPTRPSWRTATSGRGVPRRRRGSGSARGRATSSRSSGGRRCGDWRGRAGSWDTQLQAERDKAAARGGGEVGAASAPGLVRKAGRPARRAGRAGADDGHPAGTGGPGRHPVRADRGGTGGHPRRPATPEGARPAAGRGPSRSNDLAVARLSKLVVVLEWAILNEALPPPGKFSR